VFLPESYAPHEPAGSWKHGRTALVLGAWAVVGILFAMWTFRWCNGRDA
jgi:ABC-2 type transport system permease protein